MTILDGGSPGSDFSLGSEFRVLFGEWTTHGVIVEPRKGTNAQGDVFLEPIPLPDTMVEEKRSMVIASDGTEKVSHAVIYVDPSDLPHFPDKSRVTLPSGRVAYVLAVTKLDVFGLIGHGVVATD